MRDPNQISEGGICIYCIIHKSEYHPHGDSSVEDVITQMANWYSMYMPLAYSESNMGSMQGDGAAASRYTEVMLSKFAIEAIFKDLIETPDIVDWNPTYTGDKLEPEYLPVAVPLLLINGTFGMGVGYSTSVPPHNINEVLDATIKLIDNPNYQVVLVPDQCMACDIIEANWKQISNTGVGTFKVRARIDIELFNKGKPTEHYALVVKSRPDRVIIDNGKGQGVAYQINKLIEDGKLPQVTGIFEDSHDNDMRYVIHLKKGADPAYVREYLYKSTSLQVSQSVNFSVLHGIDQVRFSYTSYLKAFLIQRKTTKFRKYCNLLQKVKTNIHEKELCIKIITSPKLDELIKRIRNSKYQNDAETIEWMIKYLNLTDLQAKFIINYPLKKLSPAYIKYYKDELAKAKEVEARCMDMILNEDKIMQEIKDELIYFRQKYGFVRKSRVISLSELSDIPKGTFNVVITENNFIKKLPENEPIGAYKGDNPVNVLKIDNTNSIILITSHGRMFKVPVHKIPIAEKNSIGTDIRIMVKGIASPIVGMFDYNQVEQLSKLKSKWYAVICTENNYIKKVDLDDLLIATPSGIILTKLNNGDSVKEVKLIPNNIDLVIYSKRKALRVHMTDIPNYRRNTIGVYAMNTSDKLDGISAIEPSVTDIVVITDSGKVNKFAIAGLAVSERYKAGSTVIKLGKTETIHSLFGAKDSDILHITTKNTKMDINVGDIERTSSISAGNKLINLKNDMIVSITIEY